MREPVKIDLHFGNLEYVRPPGSLVEILEHPYFGESRAIELALFNEHRYAFFFWNKWTQELLKKDANAKPPSLVSLDWHQDLMWPDEAEKEWLEELELGNNRDVSLYSWANLTSINDGQIMAAAYLNLIGDIFVHCRQGKFDSHWQDEVFIDRYGNQHVVRKFKKYEDLENALLVADIERVYFDIDLDFFTIQNPYNGAGKKYTYMTNAAIKEILQPERPLVSWVFRRLCGFTIAMEHEHTGGLMKANKLLGVIDRLYFKPSLFTNYGDQWEKNTAWRHLDTKI